MKMYNICISLLTLSFISIGSSNDSSDCINTCVYSVRHLPEESEGRQEKGRYQPLYLVQNGKNRFRFVIPTDEGLITLKENEEIYIGCPKEEGEKIIYVTKYSCEISNSHSLKERFCESHPQLTVKKTDQKCGKKGDGKIQKYGYNVINADFLDVFEACVQFSSDQGKDSFLGIANTFLEELNKHLESTLDEDNKSQYVPLVQPSDESISSQYASYTLHTSQFGSRRFFCEGSAIQSPLNEEDKSEISKIFPNLVGEEIKTKNSKLMEFPLVDINDFVFASQRRLGTVLGWSTILCSKWLELSNDIRLLDRQDLKIYVGPVGNMQGDMAEKPLPLQVWKLVQNSMNECMAFVLHNIPVGKVAQNCKTSCSQNGWPKQTNDYSKGYIECCTYDEISQIKNFVFLPEVVCSKELKGPKKIP